MNVQNNDTSKLLCSFSANELPPNLTYIWTDSWKLSLGGPHTQTSCIRCTELHVHTLLLRWFVQRICPSLRISKLFYNKLISYGERLLAQHPTLKLEDHPLSCVLVCLFSVFTATLDSWRPSLHQQPQNLP